MAAALDAGAAIVNDVSALAYDPAAAPLVAARLPGRADAHARHARDDASPGSLRRCGGRGDAGTRRPDRGRRSAPASRATGSPSIPASASPRRAAHSLELLRRLPVLARLGCPILVGVSRKSFIWGVAGVARPDGRGCRARWPPGCSRCRAAPPSCGCTTWPRPCRRCGSGRRWHVTSASIARPARLHARSAGQADGDDTRETSVRHRRHPRHRQHRADDRRDRAAARPGGRAAVHPRQPPPPRGDRQGHAAVRLHDGAGADRGVHRRRAWT